MKNINVLQLIDSLNVGGAEVLAVNIHNLLNKEINVNSFLCASRKEGDLIKRIDNVNNYVFLQRKSTLDFKAVAKLLKFVSKNKITIIHAHSSSYFLAFSLKVIQPKIKIIWHDHHGLSDFLDERKKQPLKFISKYFSYSIFVNQNLLKWSKENLRIRNGEFLNNFVWFKNDEKVTVLKGLEGKKIIKIAAFRAQKDHLNLLKAFNNILNKHQDWTLHLIGKSYDDKYFREILNFINDKKLNKKVFFYGVCADIKNILSQTDIGVLSSKSEGLPVSLLEYGLAKLSVVVTNVGECNQVVNDNYSGYIVNKNKSCELEDALNKLIISKEKRINFGVKLYNHIIENYSKEKFINDLLKIYRTKLD